MSKSEAVATRGESARIYQQAVHSYRHQRITLRECEIAHETDEEIRAAVYEIECGVRGLLGGKWDGE